MIDISWNNRKTLVTNSFLCDYATTGRSSAHPSHSDSCWRCIGRETEKEARSERGEGEGRGIRDECTRKEWKTEGKGGGREEGSTPRYCTRLHGCAHNRTGPRKTPFQVRSPPWKTYFLLFVARARSDRIHWIPPIPIFRAPIFRNTCHAFTSSLV